MEIKLQIGTDVKNFDSGALAFYASFCINVKDSTRTARNTNFTETFRLDSILSGIIVVSTRFSLHQS